MLYNLSHFGQALFQNDEQLQNFSEGPEREGKKRR